jgi:hypothetical protein
MSIIGSNILAGASGQAGGAGGYEISRSVRFNSSDSTSLSKNFGSAGNRKTWTWAGWVKKNQSTNSEAVFSAKTYATGIYINDTGGPGEIAIDFSTGTTSGTRTLRYTSAVFRDFSSWYHIVAAVDTTQAVNSDRMKLYVNGVQQALDNAAVGTWPVLNAEGHINSTVEHAIGYRRNTSDYRFNGYLADIHFIDGQALDPTSFGEFDTNGVWQPIEYAGTFGTNGFHLPFSDNSTAAALGTDTSSNGNTWTVNNISVTAGAGNDSLVDSPTNYGTDTGAGGEVRGNYATLNPLDNGGIDLSNGNLGVSNGAAHEAVRSTIKLPSSGKWYAECTLTSASPGVFAFGIDYSNATNPASYVDSNKAYIAVNATSLLIATDTQYDLTTTTANAILMVAYDSGTQNLWLGFNGNWYTTAFATTGNPANGTNPTAISIPNGFLTVAAYSATGDVNFGQRQWAYAAPAGFKALCTTNLPEPTIADGSTAMDVVTYTGNGSTQTISGLNFSPDFGWFKRRGPSAASHFLFDQVRGAGKFLVSNTTAAEGNDSVYTLQSFNSDGYTMGNTGAMNESGSTYVVWSWDAGSSTVTNTAGSRTSQVRANASAGFSIVTYTGGGVGSTMGHGLGVTPSLIIAKSRTATGNWSVNGNVGGLVYGTNKLVLNLTDAIAADTNEITAANSTTFTGGGSAATSGSGVSYVAYCFAPVSGYSAYGSYTGNGSADGVFVFTGMRPRWIMFKRTDTTADWLLLDTARDNYNAVEKHLHPNLSNAEATGSPPWADILSNGFKLRNTYGETNASGGTYIYACFSEHPFATARAR